MNCSEYLSEMYANSTREQEDSEVTVSAKMKLLSDQDRTGLYRLGTASESLNPVCSLSCMHTAGFSKHFFFPPKWSSRAALNRAKCPTRAMASLRVLQWEAERTDMVRGRNEGKKKNPTAKATPGSECLIIHRPPFAVLIYMKIYSVCHCSRLLPLALWLKSEWDVRM